MDFTQVKHRDEIILWRGKPNFAVYFLKDIAALTGIIIWIFTLSLLPWIVNNISGLSEFSLEGIYTEEPSLTQEEKDFRTGSFALISTLFTFPLILIYLVILFAPINALLNYLDEDYALTDQRVLISKGAIKTRIVSFYFDDIKNLELQTGTIDGVFSVGTIKIYTGQINFEGGWAEVGKNWLVGVEKPEQLYRLIEEKSKNLSKAVYF